MKSFGTPQRVPHKMQHWWRGTQARWNQRSFWVSLFFLVKITKRHLYDWRGACTKTHRFVLVLKLMRFVTRREFKRKFKEKSTKLLHIYVSFRWGAFGWIWKRWTLAGRYTLPRTCRWDLRSVGIPLHKNAFNKIIRFSSWEFYKVSVSSFNVGATLALKFWWLG